MEAKHFNENEVIFFELFFEFFNFLLNLFLLLFSY
jgi:hypothetical protein